VKIHASSCLRTAAKRIEEAMMSITGRRTFNKRNALRYARIGIYGFVSNEKTPLVPRYNKADVALSQEEREAAIAEFVEKHGEPPVHVGATRNSDVVKRLFQKYPDAVWSIATGPNNLVVIDADAKDDGQRTTDRSAYGRSSLNRAVCRPVS